MKEESEKLWGYCAYSWVILTMMVAAGLLTFPSAASAQQTWHVQAGAESKSQALQADAFLPNEIWIYAGDSVQFTFPDKNEIHTATLLEPGQLRPLFAGPPQAPVGCDMINAEPVAEPSGSSYDGAGAMGNLACVNSGPLNNGASYTINFPVAGNYKLVCLVHADMNGVIHVLQYSDPQGQYYAASLPYQQSDYDRQARDEARALLKDPDIPQNLLTGKDDGQAEHGDSPHSENVVLMTGEMKATPGGRQYLAVVRFLPGTIKIHAGETVEWVNADPTEPHTVTFGTAPPAPTMVVNATPGSDGALEATINSPADNVSSGFLQAAPQDRSFLAQSAPGITRLRIKFTKPGIYPYYCDLHDVDGMLGKVIVVP